MHWGSQAAAAGADGTVAGIGSAFVDWYEQNEMHEGITEMDSEARMEVWVSTRSCCPFDFHAELELMLDRHNPPSLGAWPFSSWSSHSDQLSSLQLTRQLMQHPGSELVRYQDHFSIRRDGVECIWGHRENDTAADAPAARVTRVSFMCQLCPSDSH